MTLQLAEIAPPGAPAAAAAYPAIRIIPGRWIAAGVALALGGVLLLMLRAGLTIRLGDPVNLLIASLAALAVALRSGYRAPRTERQRIARDAAEYFGVFVLLCLLGAVASYAVAATTHGWVDETLHRFDLAVGFDWLAWYGLVAAHPGLQILSRAAYGSIFVTPALLLGHFARAGRTGEARRLIAAFWLAAVITLTLFWFMPARGALDFLWHGPIPYLPMSELYQADIIPLLRDSAMRQVDLGQIRGLVGPPSFHAACATLFIGTAWRVPRVRRWLVTLNLAMIAAIPVEGTHYLMDILLGAAVALLALWIAARLTAPRGQELTG